MNTSKIWHENDDFWHTFADSMFTPERYAGASGEVDQIIALTKLSKGTAILDLCCGPGRHSLELARRGHNVTGFDRTALYLEKARKCAKKEHLAVKFMRGDMRKLHLPNKFNCVINMFTAFGYFEKKSDDKKVMENIYSCLKKGGVLLMELMGKEILARIFLQNNWSEKDGVLFLAERTISKDWTWIENRWILINGSKKKEFRVAHRLYSAAELCDLAKSAGFRKVRVFGGLNGCEYNNEAKRLVLVARK